jgi:uncharacterized membrane protein
MLSLSRAALLSALVVSAASSAVNAQSSYTLTRVDGIDAVFDLNDKGEIVGREDLGGGETDFLTRAVLWSNGEIVPLTEAIPGQTPQAEATAINNSSEVAIDAVVIADGRTTRRTYLWKNGERRDLGLPAGAREASARGMNARTQIVGNLVDAAHPAGAAFLWQRGLFEIVSGPAGFGASRINDSGVILLPPGVSSGGAFTAFVPPPGANRMEGRDLNNHAQVAGFASYPDGTLRAVLWQEGQSTVLPQPDASFRQTIATDINDDEHVVGWTSNPDTQQLRPLLWVDRNAYDLRDLIHAADPLAPFVSLRAAIEINEQGQIVAGGEDSRDPAGTSAFYLLTPRS